MRIAVAGAGPAGVAIANRLTDLGHMVAILAAARQNSRIEGLPFRVFDGLRAAGLGEAIADLPAAAARHSCWNGIEQSVGEEWLVARDAFDAKLCVAARRFATVHDAHLITVSQSCDGVDLAIETLDGVRSCLPADFVIDARGRGTPARGDRLTGAQTAALYRRYRTAAPPAPSTWLETSPQGWAWLAVPSSGDAYLQISVAAERGSLPGRQTLDVHFGKLLRQFPGVRERLHDAEPAGSVHARLATPSLCTEPAAGRLIRVGDAAMAIDSLSGHGVFEAIAGAFAAAAVVNTILHRPQDADLARRFYRDRLAATFWAHALSGQAHYRREERWSGSPFWAARQRWPGADTHTLPVESTIVRRAVIDNGWIRECDVIVTPQQPRGVWRFDGVPVVHLREMLTAGEVDGAEAASRALGVPVAAAASAIDWLAQVNLSGRHSSD